MVSELNWQNTHYTDHYKRYFISHGGQLHNNQYCELYFLTISDMDFKELYQETYYSIDAALERLNKKYSHLELVDIKQKVSSSSCSTCSAH